ncbi:MAG: ribonuclease R [Christensenellaceae bacterium]
MDIKEKVLKVIEKKVYADKKDLFGNIKAGKKTIDNALGELESAHAVGRTKQGKYALAHVLGFFKGTIEIKKNGFGFLRTGGELGDIYVAREGMRGAINGDTVLVKLRKRQSGRKNLEGKVVEILSPAERTVVGIVQVYKKTVYVVSEELAGDIYIPRDKAKKIKDGQMVVVKLLKRPEGRKSAEGEIVEVLGMPGEKGVDILAIARSFGLNARFSKEVERAASKLKNEEFTLEGREDFTKECVITIDGADAKDLDDAVSLKVLKNGDCRLTVHIADVSHYVREGDILDKEAMHRGTSAYLIDQVVPMLPKVLSNDLCSLNPGELKYTLSCMMEIGKDGEVKRHRFYKGVIKTRYRMTYSDVNMILEGDKELAGKYKGAVRMLNSMNGLAKQLREKRFLAGSIDFDLPEAKITLDDNGAPVEIGVRERGDAEKLIEEFMLLTNCTVAEHFYRKDIPFIYRTHEQPDPESMHELAVFLKNFGVELKGVGDIQPKAIQEVLTQVEGTDEAGLINSVTLRSLKKAKYDTHPVAHFGLAADWYCHFTSPIRRYPDLAIHRIVKAFVEGKLSPGYEKKLEGVLETAAKQSSERERNAIEAERAVDNMKMAEYMSARIGEEHEGVVSGVTNFGIFVELENTIEGMIPLATLDDDYYEYEEKQHCVVGKRTAKRITLGDRVNIKVVHAEISTGKIEFAFA